ncbi:MAG: GGDEF domain-containing protein, partial [Clostridia bacterium]|nr:GGDEF domain-containing protein [Clostridia bacterium]
MLVIFLIHNIRSKRKALATQKLIKATEIDTQTGLYSKSFFHEYAVRMYNDAPDKPMDAAVLNIEQFHSINAMYGWEFGDNVIRALGEEIDSFISTHGGIAGHGEGDRFALYFPHLDNYTNLFERLQNRLIILSPNAGIWLRMGVKPYEKDMDPRQMVEQALLACNLARGRYIEHIVIFDNHIRDRERYEQRLKSDVEHAIANREFELYYQPRYDITVDPPAVSSAEALVRWHHPDLGVIQPNDFIPLFERNGQVSDIDRYVWEEVTEQIERWYKEYGVIIPVSVNLSRVDIFDPALMSRLDVMLESHGLDKKALKLEVTESAYTENSEDVIAVIEDLREKGYEIEMDDFGTGYSSLTLLSDMPINALKLDRAFVKNIGREEKDDHIIKVILDIAKTLKIPVIAEGVETEQQLKFLKDLGCEYVQGFYFSRPLPSYEFEDEYLEKL